MRAFAAAGAVAAAAVTWAGPGLAQEGFAFPSCISSTLAASTARFIPPEAKGPPARLLRGIVVRSLTWRPGAVVKVCFRSGSKGAQERVVRYASEWMQHANVVFDFLDGNSPRKCKGDGLEDIKIDFIDGRGWWSYYGTAGRARDPSMNLQFFGIDRPMYTNGQPAPEAEMRRIILHEFGHALGMLHEHQSPTASCDAEIDWDVAYKMGEQMGWGKEQVNQNFRQLMHSDEFNMTDVDRKSIMHYSLPPELFRAGKQSRCWIAGNMDLSEKDRTFIAGVYPKTSGPPVVSSLPTATEPAATGSPSATRGAKPMAVLAPSEDKDSMVKQYQDLLRQAGVSKEKIEDLAREFRKSLIGN